MSRPFEWMRSERSKIHDRRRLCGAPIINNVYFLRSHLDLGFRATQEETMNIELNADEVELLKMLLLAELEEKRVEIHHAKNIEYKSELQKQEKLISGIVKRF
jgi:hypothetical protein